MLTDNGPCDFIVTLGMEKGTDLEYGARPLKRAVQKIFEDKLSEEIISGRITNESDVTIDVVDGEIVFNKN